MILQSGVWSVLKSFKVDELIALKTSYNSFLRKVLPRSKAYRPEQFEYPVTPTFKMVLDRHDYSQWRIFSGKFRINPRIFDYFKINTYSFTMIDVGANVGGFSILLSKEIDVEHFNTHLFEPNPAISRTLEENVSRLSRINLPFNPHVNFAALGDMSTTLPLKVNDKHSGTSTLGKSKRPYSRVVDVQVTTIDEYVRTKQMTDLDFIKVDAEAYEPAVLRGAMETITAFKPTIYFEYSRDWFENFSAKYISTVFTYLTSLGYFFLREGKDGKFNLFAVNEYTLKQYRHLNILAVMRYELRKYQ